MKRYIEVMDRLFGQEIAEEKTGYQKFFEKTLKKYGVNSPAELNDKMKKKFFDEIENGWTAKNEDHGGKEYFEDKLKKIKEVSEIKMVGDSRVDFEYSTYMVSLMGIDSVECTYTDISVQRGVSGLEERVVSSLQDVGISKA